MVVRSMAVLIEILTPTKPPLISLICAFLVALAGSNEITFDPWDQSPESALREIILIS